MNTLTSALTGTGWRATTTRAALVGLTAAATAGALLVGLTVFTTQSVEAVSQLAAIGGTMGGGYTYALLPKQGAP